MVACSETFDRVADSAKKSGVLLGPAWSACHVVAIDDDSERQTRSPRSLRKLQGVGMLVLVEVDWSSVLTIGEGKFVKG